MSAQTPMPKYKCHKEVWALKIVEVLNGRADGAGPGATLVVEEPFSPISVSDDWDSKHKAEAGGYYVQYEDGYTSFSPATAFESGYTKIDPVNVKEEYLLQFFQYHHLPPRLQKISKPFGEVAAQIISSLPKNPERTVALRKLLEAKDCAVRAQLFQS